MPSLAVMGGAAVVVGVAVPSLAVMGGAAAVVGVAVPGLADQSVARPFERFQYACE